jgi:hypothetical protein
LENRGFRRIRNAALEDKAFDFLREQTDFKRLVGQ